MKRNGYIGSASIGGVSTSTPLQSEAAAYFARMSVAPSAAYQEAANRAIFRWKQAGLWSQIKGLWLHCADNHQASLLSVIGDAPRDAVIVGSAPTHTARKGYSGFDATHGLKYPITAAILANDNVFNFMAGVATQPATPNATTHYYMVSDGGNGAHVPGHWQNSGGLLVFNNGEVARLSGTANASVSFIGGPGVGIGNIVKPGTWDLFSTATRSARSSNYVTGSDANTTLARLVAYGFADASLTNAQRAKFLTILNDMIDTLGAFD